MAERKLRSKRGGWAAERQWIAKDDTGWYLIAAKKDDNAHYNRAKFAGEGIELKAMRFASDSLQARTNMRIETTSFEFNALMKLALAGHVGVWRVDVRGDGQFWSDLWSERNAAPCAVVAKLGIREEGKGKRAEVLEVDYTVGARFKRDGRKTEGREINAYLDAWPEDAAKPRVGGFREAIEKDGILVAPRQRMPELIELAKYVVIDDGLRGYQIWDRVFWDDGSGARKTKRPELTTFAQKYGPDKDKLSEFEHQILSDKIFASSNSHSPIPIPQSLLQREFGRIVITGTMAWRRQMGRPAHEVALGIWLAGLT